jgi:hypothetical protein
MSEYGSLREKIAAESAARKGRYAKFEAVYNKAVAAGRAAGEAAAPQPMVVQDGRSGQSWFVGEGVCGFAWVSVTPGNSSFAKWLAKQKLARKAYEGGMQIWISAFNQSMQRKQACAEAMAEIFRNELGVKAYAGSRMD